MEISIVFGVITLVFLWYNLWIGILIVRFLKSNGKEVSLFNSGFYIKGKIFKYLPLYRETTRELSGKTGSLYYQFYFSFVMAMIFLLLGILTVV